MISTETDAARRMVIPAELRHLERLAAWTDEFARSAKLADNVLFAIQLCIEEAVANVIMYSGAAEQHQEVVVELVRAGSDVLAIIEDGGRSFDPTTVPPRRKPTSIEDAPIGELGVHLMRSFASDMRYERRDGRNRLILRFGSVLAVGREAAR